MEQNIIDKTIKNKLIEKLSIKPCKIVKEHYGKQRGLHETLVSMKQLYE